MKVLFYSTNQFEQTYLEEAKQEQEVLFLSESLSLQTAALAKGFECISIFTTDDASAKVLQALKQVGVRYIAIRATGYDNVDIEEANNLGILLANIPELYSYAVAEHAVCLLLTLNRRIILANEKIQHHDFTIDNLIGFNLHGKKVGVIGTGKVGSQTVKILNGFGCTILGYDIKPNKYLEEQYNVYYVGLFTLCSMSDVIVIHVPLTKNTYHLINRNLFRKMKNGVYIINTSRGAIIDTQALVEGLDNGQIGAAGLDVYENEKNVFYKNLTQKNLQDPVLLKLLSFRNVLITSHQAFATKESLTYSANTTFANIFCWENKTFCKNQITLDIQTTLIIGNNKALF